MDQSVQERVIQLGLAWGADPPVHVGYQLVSIYVILEHVSQPVTHQVLQLFEGDSAGGEFIQVDIELSLGAAGYLGECRMVGLLLDLVGLVEDFIEFLKEL